MKNKPGSQEQTPFLAPRPIQSTERVQSKKEKKDRSEKFWRPRITALYAPNMAATSKEGIIELQEEINDLIDRRNISYTDVNRILGQYGFVLSREKVVHQIGSVSKKVYKVIRIFDGREAGIFHI